MKTQDEIEDRIRFILVEELDRRVTEASSRLPHLCTHNHRQPLDTRKQVEGSVNEEFNRISNRRGLPVLQTMGLCMLGAENPEEWRGDICEDPIDAQRCPYFTPTQTKAMLNADFRRDVEDLAWVHLHMPGLYELLWALDTGTPPPLPLWKRLWYRMLRIRTEPVRSNVDVMRLFPDAPKLLEAPKDE